VFVKTAGPGRAGRAGERYTKVKHEKAVQKIAIVGLPNTGKSHVFNALTGKYTIVANYPHTTVEIKDIKCAVGDKQYIVYDTPGLHSLYIHSEEETVVRDMLFTERPDIFIQCIDANQVKQSLTLTADLLELGIPMVIALNAIDETVQKGIAVNSEKLSEMLGVPVVELPNLEDRDPKKLVDAVQRAKVAVEPVAYGETLEAHIAAITGKLPYSVHFKRKVSILLLENDTTVIPLLKKELDEAALSDFLKEVETVRRKITGSIGRSINDKRNKWGDRICEHIIKKRRPEGNRFLLTFAQLCRHPVYGIPILLFFIAVTYLLVVHFAGFIEGLLNAFVVNPIVNAVNTRVAYPFLNEFLVGNYGILTLGLFNAFCTVLPILSVFFLLFGTLEDIGYIPNLCVLTNRLFRKIGITGKSIMPLVLGFGCKTMATLTTRGLQSRKEKFIAIYLIAFAIPCSAQLGLNMAILGKVGVKAFIIAFAALAFVEIGAGLILNKILKEDSQSDFIQELPPIRIPNFGAIVTKTYYRLVWFLKEAAPIFIIAALALFLADKSGALEILKRIMSPIVIGWLGLPIDTVEALILTMARHEAAAGLLLKMVSAGALNYVQSIVAVVITTMFVPCFANIVAMCKEIGLKKGLAMMAVINISSFFLAGLLNWLLVAFL